MGRAFRLTRNRYLIFQVLSAWLLFSSTTKRPFMKILKFVGTSGRLFNALANQKINIIMITQGSSEHSICMVVKPSDGIKAREVIEQEFALEIAAHYIDPVVVETGYSVVAAIGENMQHIPVISKKF